MKIHVFTGNQWYEVIFERKTTGCSEKYASQPGTCCRLFRWSKTQQREDRTRWGFLVKNLIYRGDFRCGDTSSSLSHVKREEVRPWERIVSLALYIQRPVSRGTGQTTRQVWHAPISEGACFWPLRESVPREPGDEMQ